MYMWQLMAVDTNGNVRNMGIYNGPDDGAVEAEVLNRIARFEEISSIDINWYVCEKKGALTTD